MANPIELQKTLAGMSYPAGKNDLIQHAKSNGADNRILDELEKLPDREFDGPDQVQEAAF